LAHTALVPELTSEEDVQLELNNLAFVMQVVANLMVYIVFLLTSSNLFGGTPVRLFTVQLCGLLLSSIRRLKHKCIHTLDVADLRCRLPPSWNILIDHVRVEYFNLYFGGA
jgi:hypothetical protein